MKKIFAFFSIAALGLLTVSCNLNEMPKFNPDDAFAAFQKATLKVSEDGGTISIPVHIASLDGIATTVTYEFVDGTAVKGKDYEDASGTGSLTFTSIEDTKNIVVKILPHIGTFTGDINFSVKFKSTGDVKVGANNICTVTINDTDHPLAMILGTYTATGEGYWDGVYSWPMEFKKDASDVTKVWIDNIFGDSGWSGDDTMFYGVVNDEKTMITLPLGQETEYKYKGTTPCVLLGFDGTDGYDEGNMNIAIKDGGATLEFIDYGPWLYIPGAGSVNIIYPGVICKK
jgi:hypothetical protein